MKKALFIVPISVCGPPDDGGSQRTRLLFSALLQQYEVDVLIVGSGVADMHKKPFASANAVHEGIHESPSDAGLWRVLQNFAPIELAHKIASLLRPRIVSYSSDQKMRESMRQMDFSRYDLIVGRFFRPTARAGVLTEKDAPPVVIDIDDRDDRVFETRNEANRFNPVLGALNRWHARQIRTIMAELLPRARHLWFVSREDADGFNHPSTSLLPNISFHAPETPPPPAPTSRILLFVGSAVHQPNARGVRYFLKACWPAIFEAAPDAVFRIVGKGWEALPQALAKQPGVQVAGFVDDIADEYAAALAAISPIYDGGGTKIKVVEAMAYGRPVLVDIHSALGVTDGRADDGVVVAQNDAEMIAACLRLLRAPEEAARLAARAHAASQKRASRASFAAQALHDCAAAIESAG
ncbi:MAG: glycosyltransferase [Pseudomonadota bacterium]